MLEIVSKADKVTDLWQLSLMGNMSFYNTPTADKLYNTGYQYGKTIGAGRAAGVDFNIIPNGTGDPYKGITFSGGLGCGDIHCAVSDTRAITPVPFSVYDLADAMMKGFLGLINYEKSDIDDTSCVYVVFRSSFKCECLAQRYEFNFSDRRNKNKTC